MVSIPSMDPLGVISYPFIMPFVQVVTPFITGRGPPCWLYSDLWIDSFLRGMRVEYFLA